MQLIIITMAFVKTLIKHYKTFIIFALLIKDLDSVVLQGGSGDRSVGSDGFTDCNKICDPSTGYLLSCTLYCKDFKFPKRDGEEQSSHGVPWRIPLSIAGPVVILAVTVSSAWLYLTRTKRNFCRKIPLSVEETHVKEPQGEAIRDNYTNEETRDLIEDNVECHTSAQNRQGELHSASARSF